MHAFISYDNRDAAVAIDIAQALQLLNLQVFIDKAIPIGSRWDEVLEKALEQSYAVVVLWTQNSVSNRWVRSEARYALAKNILFPVKLDECIIPVEFSGVETANLINWSLDRQNHYEWKLLLSALRESLETCPTYNKSSQMELYYAIGMKFYSGDGVPTDKELSLEWFERAKQEGCVEAEKYIRELR